MYIKYLKRLFDIAFSLFLLILLSPVLILTGIVVLVFLGRPVLFTQERPGLNEKIFKIFKFRSMIDKYDENGQPLSDHERITKLGTFLRNSSLDELPEIFNVLIGDMSFVGPRPLIPRYLPYYTEREKKRHLVRPGITGLAQISGRNFLGWDQRFEFDVQYVENLSFSLDLSILLKTIRAVVLRKGIALDIMTDFDKVRQEGYKTSDKVPGTWDMEEN